MDAAYKANRGVTRVRFDVDEHSVSDIPLISKYEEVFDRCLEYQKGLREESGLSESVLSVVDQIVVNRIRRILDKRKCQSFFAIDNGCGLNKKDMHDLVVGEGKSGKSSKDAGSYGVGHLTAFSASDLNYILYAGIYKDTKDNEILSGHAILASHKGQKRKRMVTGDGYLSTKLDMESGKVSFQINGATPKYLSDKLEWVRSNEGTGAVVAIAGFNQFVGSEEANDLHNSSEDHIASIVKKATACNFFQPLMEGKLIVEFYRNNKQICMLDRNSTLEYLKGIQEEKRDSTQGKGMGGRSTYTACLAITQGRSVIKKIRNASYKSEIRLSILQSGEGVEIKNSRIDLCRNGMWIKKDPPLLKADKFQGRQPFHAVLTLDRERGGELPAIVRKMEGEMHDSLSTEPLDKTEKDMYKEAMTAIEDEINKLVPEEKDDSFFMDDVLNFVPPTIDRYPGKGGISQTTVGPLPPIRPEPRTPRPEEEGDAGLSPGGRSPNVEITPDGRSFNKHGFVSNIAIVSRYPTLRTFEARIFPEKNIPEAEIRFRIDDNTDVSCDITEQEIFAILSRVKINGEPIPDDRYCLADGRRYSVIVSQLKASIPLDIEFEFKAHPKTGIPDNQKITLEASVVRRKPTGAKVAEVAS